GEISTGVGNCAAFATSCPKEGVRILQAPPVTKDKNTLPVSLDVRRTNPVRRAQASIWAGGKNSVSLFTTPNPGSVIPVSFFLGRRQTPGILIRMGGCELARSIHTVVC